MTYSPVAPDPTPEPYDCRVRHLYDVLADIVVDGEMIARAGNVVNETVRERVETAVSDVDRYLRPVDQDIPVDGSVVIYDDDADDAPEWQPSEATMRYMREEVWR